MKAKGLLVLSPCVTIRPACDILIDYRPALRQRTGVGEYVHGLASALAGRLQREDSVTLFSSSWKDRLGRNAIPGTTQIDVRIPVRLLNFAWHRLEWPPIEWLARPFQVVHSLHPLLIPSRSAARLITIHDLYFLDYPEQTAAEIRRDYPALAGEHARRADGIVVNSEHTRRQVSDRFGIATGSHHCLLSGKAGLGPPTRPADAWTDPFCRNSRTPQEPALACRRRMPRWSGAELMCLIS